MCAGAVIFSEIFSGSDLKDMFPKQKDSTEDFQEPPELNGKLRWQIVQVLATKEEEQEARKVSFSIGDSKPELRGSVGSDMEHEASDKLPSHQMSHSDDEQMTEVVYKRGIYLSTNATLKDLRNAFIDSRQIEPEERMFQFLNSDVLGDSITIDTEDEVLLEQIEHRLVQHRTVYIETLAPGKIILCIRLMRCQCCMEGCRGECMHSICNKGIMVALPYLICIHSLSLAPVTHIYLTPTVHCRECPTRAVCMWEVCRHGVHRVPEEGLLQ